MALHDQQFTNVIIVSATQKQKIVIPGTKSNRSQIDLSHNFVSAPVSPTRKQTGRAPFAIMTTQPEETPLNKSITGLSARKLYKEKNRETPDQTVVSLFTSYCFRRKASLSEYSLRLLSHLTLLYTMISLLSLWIFPSAPWLGPAQLLRSKSWHTGDTTHARCVRV